LYKTKKYYEANKQYYKDKATERRLAFREIVNRIKDVPCMDCGNTFPPYVMDFDHRGDKVDNVSRLSNNRVSIARIMEEIAKCDIVCANCHRIRTYG
jgi:hypothetical protein